MSEMTTREIIAWLRACGKRYMIGGDWYTMLQLAADRLEEKDGHNNS